MNAIKILRDKLGVSQLEVSKFLDIGRPLLTLVETNKRSLPSRACHKLSRLEKALLKDSTRITIDLPELFLEKYCQDCSSRQTRLRYKILRLEEQLAALEKCYMQNQRLFNVLTDLEKDCETDPELIAKMKAKALARMVECTPVAMESIRGQIRMCLAESEQIKRFKKKFLIRPMNINKN